MINRVTLIGNLGRDPEINYLGNSNTKVANLSIATTEHRKEKKYTEWHNVTLFGKAAEIAERFLKKGSQAYVEGRLQTEKYEDRNGIERQVTKIVAHSLKILDKKEQEQGSPF